MGEFSRVLGLPAEQTNGAAVPDAVDVLARAAGVVGADRVSHTTGLGPNVSRYRSRRVGGVVRPETVAQVRELVRLFGSVPGAGLHAVSTGRNWGLGSREPTADDVVVLDLGDLAQVREVDLTGGWAVVEPGVTQGRLSQQLEGTDRMVNVTVSAAETSIVGNLVDRGVGLRHQRTRDVLGLEVVLPDGELARFGWWPGTGRGAAPYPHGLGPSALGLFTQSDLGVVTAATIALPHRPEALRVVRLDFRPDALGDVVALLRRWTAQGLTRSVSRVFDPAAARAYAGKPDLYTAHFCVDGMASAVDALVEVVAGQARDSGLFTEVDHTAARAPRHPDHEVATLVERGYAGDPDPSDRLFQAKMGHPADEIDQRVGFLFFLPLLPFTPEAVELARTLTDRVRATTGIPSASTLHLLDAEHIDCVVAMKFDRADDAATRAAHRALDLLYDLFAEHGFAPYRLDVDHAERVDDFRADEAATAFTRRLKATVDPGTALAHGRYR